MCGAQHSVSSAAQKKRGMSGALSMKAAKFTTLVQCFYSINKHDCAFTQSMIFFMKAIEGCRPKATWSWGIDDNVPVMVALYSSCAALDWLRLVECCRCCSFISSVTFCRTFLQVFVCDFLFVRTKNSTNFLNIVLIDYKKSWSVQRLNTNLAIKNWFLYVFFSDG